jgi:hypothetical protein
MGICDAPKLLVPGQTANTDTPAATFKKSLRFIGLLSVKSLGLGHISIIISGMISGLSASL